MKSCGLLYLILLIQTLAIAQVGINTTNPSSASVLDIHSSNDGIHFGGLMPPIVTSLADRNTINPGLNDIGLLIFLNDAVNSDYCIQIWNGSIWEDVHCITTPSIINIATQDFDLSQTWTYTATPSFYNVGNDIWDVVNALLDITGFTGNFLGCRDLDNPNGGGSFNHEIAFNNFDVSSYSSVQVTFDYDIFEYDNGDDVFYELFLDNVSQGIVQLINGSGNYSESGTVVLDIPGGTTNVKLTVSITQNGNDDKAGFDNFKIIGL